MTRELDHLTAEERAYLRRYYTHPTGLKLLRLYDAALARADAKNDGLGREKDALRTRIAELRLEVVSLTDALNDATLSNEVGEKVIAQAVAELENVSIVRALELLKGART